MTKQERQVADLKHQLEHLAHTVGTHIAQINKLELNFNDLAGRHDRLSKDVMIAVTQSIPAIQNVNRAATSRMQNTDNCVMVLQATVETQKKIVLEHGDRLDAAFEQLNGLDDDIQRVIGGVKSPDKDAAWRVMCQDIIKLTDRVDQIISPEDVHKMGFDEEIKCLMSIIRNATHTLITTLERAL